MSLYRILLRRAQMLKRMRAEEQDATLRRLGRKPRRRKPPEAGLPVPAVLPRGPLPKQGGAEAPLDFSA